MEQQPEQPYKEPRVRVEAPKPESVFLPVSELEYLPKFYVALTFLTLLFSGASLYLTFTALK